MESLLAVAVGVLFASGLYLLLQRHIVKLILGITLLSHGANLLIFTAAGLTEGSPPVIKETKKALQEPYADPLPQALILTAIVISFAVMAFLIALIYRTYKSVGSEDLDTMRITDQ